MTELPMCPRPHRTVINVVFAVDHFLAHEDWHGIACGLALELQVVDEVPVSKHDMSIDMLVTDAAVRKFSHKSSVNS